MHFKRYLLRFNLILLVMSLFSIHINCASTLYYYAQEENGKKSKKKIVIMADGRISIEVKLITDKSYLITTAELLVHNKSSTNLSIFWRKIVLKSQYLDYQTVISSYSSDLLPFGKIKKNINFYDYSSRLPLGDFPSGEKAELILRGFTLGDTELEEKTIVFLPDI